MKKSLLALAILGSAAGAANAASSVTMYGRVDVGYEKVSGTSTAQSGGGETRFGIKGNEDLGNGLAATFQLEGRFDLDTGAKTANRDFFDRESTVGLKGNFGHVRFGRSKSSMDRALGGYAPGERVATKFDPYSSATRHSNAMFYDFERNGFNMGFDVTTKGGALDSVEGNVQNENRDGTDIGYGVHAGYAIGGFRMNAAYQADKNGYGVRLNDTNGNDLYGPASNGIVDISATQFRADKEWGVGMAYKFNMFEVGATYAEAKSDKDLSDLSQKMKTSAAYVTANVTANDSLYVRYMEKRFKVSEGSDYAIDKIKVFSAGYKHDLSKRTSVYLDYARYAVSGGQVDSSNQYDIAMRHSF